MFELDAQRSWVEAQPKEVIYLATSINRPTVAPPDRTPEAAQAYICSLLKREGVWVYIYLHLISSNTGLLYRWSEGAVSKTDAAALQQNALEFTESMGFMMDDLRFRELPPAQQEELFAQTPLFHEDISFLKPPEESVAEIEVIDPEEAADELVIEAVEEPAAGAGGPAGGETPEAEVEEITLEGIGEEEPAAEPTPAAAVPSEEEVAIEAVAAEPANEEDILLDQLEAKEETVSAAPAAEAVDDAVTVEPAGEGEESSALLDALEAQEALAPPLPSGAGGGAESEPEGVEIAVMEEGEDAAPAVAEAVPAAPVSSPPPVSPPKLVPTPSRPSPAPLAAAVETDSEETEFSSQDWEFLVRLLAMM